MGKEKKNANTHKTFIKIKCSIKEGKIKEYYNDDSRKEEFTLIRLL